MGVIWVQRKKMQICCPKFVQNWSWWLPKSPPCNAIDTNKLSFWCPVMMEPKLFAAASEKLNFGPKNAFLGPIWTKNRLVGWFRRKLYLTRHLSTPLFPNCCQVVPHLIAPNQVNLVQHMAHDSAEGYSPPQGLEKGAHRAAIYLNPTNLNHNIDYSMYSYSSDSVAEFTSFLSLNINTYLL